MRMLLDTHILLWWMQDDPILSSRARALISEPENEVFISSISLWEVAIKAKLGKLATDVNDVRTAASANQFLPLPFSHEHAVAVAQLADYHRDPFDRALIAQAGFEPLFLLTHDELLASYGDMVMLV